jgi:hypothetical protein
MNLVKPQLAFRKLDKFVRRTVVWNVMDKKQAYKTM